MLNERVRLGVIGNGDAAAMVLKNFTTNDRFEIVAGVDTEPRARARFEQEFHAPTCTSVDELLRSFTPEGVYIATPTRLHEEQTIACLQAGLHVLVEKPISTTLESAQRMIVTAAENNLTLMVCHKRSVDRPIIAMWQALQSGELGRVRAVHRWHFTDWFYRPRSPDERNPETGGVVLRQGAHEYDIIRLLAGTRATSLRGLTGDYDQKRPGEGAYYSWIEHDDGILATSIYGGYGHFLSDEFTEGLGDGLSIGKAKNILDTKANTPETETELKRAEAGGPSAVDKHPAYGFTLVNCERGDMRPSPNGGIFIYDNAGRREISVGGIAGTAVIADEFFRAITGNNRPLHDGEWGLACLEQCLAIRSSAKRHETVPLMYQGHVDNDVASNVLGRRELEVIQSTS